MKKRFEMLRQIMLILISTYFKTFIECRTKCWKTAERLSRNVMIYKLFLCSLNIPRGFITVTPVYP